MSKEEKDIVWLGDSLDVLHCFIKKSRTTSKTDVSTAGAAKSV